MFVLQIVRLHFLRFFYYYYCNNRVNIYDGPDSSAPLVLSACGGTRPGDVVSSGNTLFLSFWANGYHPYNDFRIVYHAIEPGKTKIRIHLKKTGVCRKIDNSYNLY